MSKTIKVNVDLDDKEAKQKLKDLQEGKYKVDLDVNVGGAKQATQTLNQMGASGKTTTTVSSKLKNAIADTFSSGKLAMTGYLAILKSIGSAADNAKKTIDEYDKSITDLSVAMNDTREEASQYIQTLNKQAVALKTTTKSASDAADTWLRQGKSVAETETLIQDSLVLSKVGKIESADAADYLTSALNGYKLEAKDAIGVIDKLTAVDAVSASESGGLAVSMSKAASAADMAGVSMDKLVGWIATVKETTRAADEEVGNSLKTMLSRMNQVKAGKFIDEETGESLNDFEKVLGKIGIALRDANGQFISSEKVLDELGQKFNTLDSVTQRAVATTLGGSFQYTKVIALLSNYEKSLKYAEVAENSAGSAMKKFETSYLDSLEAKQAALQATFESAIMNSDINAVYGNILEATTALVEFIDKTNALKGALSGLAAYAGIKAFMNIKTGAIEAYTELNKFTNAVKIAGSANISTADFDKLLLLSDGLSKRQMKLVLSTNSLTLAQKKELLVASGLSEQEAIATLQTWKMSAANNGLTVSTTSASNAMKGFILTLKANPLLLLASAVTIGASAWQKYKQSIEEADQVASEAASTYENQSSSIEEYISQYQELRKQLIGAKGNEEETKVVKEQLLELQKQINEEFGNEYGKLNLVTDAYKDQTEAIRAYNKEAANDFLNKNRKAIQRATDKMTEDKTYYLGSLNYSVDDSELPIIEKIKSIASDNGIQLLDDNSFGFSGGAEEASKVINAFMNQLKELQEQSGATSEGLSNMFDGLLDGASEELKKSDSIIDEYQARYRQGQLAEIATNSKMSGSYNTVIDAVQRYNDALAKSDDPYNDKAVKDAYDNLQSIKQTISDDSSWDSYRNIINDTFDEADTDTYEFRQNLIQNKDGIKDCAEALKGLSETDLQSMLDSGDNGSFNKLIASVKTFGLSIDDVIAALKYIGIIAPDSFTEITDTIGKSKSEMIGLINSMSDGFDVLDKIMIDVKNGDVFDFTNLNTKKFEEAFSGLGDEYTSFIEKVSSSPNDIKGCQDAFDNLVTAWLDSNGILNDVTDDTAQLTISMLENMGVANAEEIVTATLAQRHEEAAIAKTIEANSTSDLSNVTATEITNLLNEGVITDSTAQKMAAFALKKQFINQNTINTAADCENILRLAQIAGAGTTALAELNSIKQQMSMNPNMPDTVKKGLTNQVNSILQDVYDSATVDIKIPQAAYKGGDTSNKKSSSKSGSSSKDTYKEAFEKEYNALKHNLEMEYITEEQYYNGVQALNDKYFKGKEKYLDEYQKYEEEVYKGLKSYYKDYVDKQMDYYEKALDANRITFSMYSSAVKNMLDGMWESGKLSAEDYWSYVEKMLNKQKDIYDAVLSAITNRLDKEIDLWQDKIDALEDANDKLNEQKDNYDSILSAVSSVYDKEIDRLNEQKDAIQDQIDALKDKNDELDRQKQKEEALYNLQRAQQQRTKKIYVEGHGYIYREDSDAIKDAQKDLDDITNEELTDALEKEQEKLQESIDILNQYKDKWNEISDAWQETTDRQLAIELWGRDYEQMILKNRTSDIDRFKNDYLAIQDKINSNEQLINSYKEKVDYYNQLKDQWSSLTDEYERQMNEQYAAQLLGADWESQVISGRIDVLNSFRDQYMSIQKAIKDAAWNSANEQIAALNAVKAAEATKAQTSGGSGGNVASGTGGGNSLGGNTSTSSKRRCQARLAGTVKVLYETTSEADLQKWITNNGYMNTSRTVQNNIIVYFVKSKQKVDKYRVVNGKTGKVMQQGFTSMSAAQNYINNTQPALAKYLKVEKYAKGTTNARKGWNLVGEDKPELIVRNNGNVELAESEQLYNFQGGETVIPGDETKEILKNQGNVTRLPDGRELLADGSVKFPDGTILTPVANPLENLAQTDFLKAMENLQLPHYQQRPMDYGNVAKTEMVDQSISIGEIHVHEVRNVDQFAKEIVTKFPQKVLHEMYRRK